MFDDILFPTDGRPGTERALGYALNLASVFHATLHALYVVDTGPTPEPLPENERAALREHLEQQGESATIAVQNRGRDLSLDVVREVREGNPYEAILDFAEEQDVDGIVMGTRGRTADSTHLGSATERVLARANVPVLTVALGQEEFTPEMGTDAYDRIVIPTDGSDAAERATEQALTIAEQYDADVRAIYVVDTTTYGYEDAPRSIVGLLKEGGSRAVEDVAAEARDRGLSVSTAVLRGAPEDALLQYADGAGADLVAMGTRGRGGDDRLLGSTTARVVRRSQTPILTVR